MVNIEANRQRASSQVMQFERQSVCVPTSSLQPRSQGLSSSCPMERETETLVWSGHVRL